ncbi:hypothetical protein EDC94DRAFT_520149, partial [Helicostylum pulchrum]
RDELRQFYHSKKFVNEKRHIEIQKHRFRHRLCTKERRKLGCGKGDTIFTNIYSC